jgi:exonuclease III
MKILSWNCQGLGNPRTVRALLKLLQNNQPDIIFIMETKLHNLSPQFKAKFAATYSLFFVNCALNGTRGRSGGLLLLWNNCTCHVDINNMDFNYIDCLITNTSSSAQWHASGVYGYPQHHNKHLTCELIKNLANNHNNHKWLLFGDFNLITSCHEKSGGNPLDNNITTLFRNTLTMCDLQDLGYKGEIFTWNNKQEGNHLIKSRLDRFLANSDWISLFPYYSNSHLLRYKSNHSPIFLDFAA